MDPVAAMMHVVNIAHGAGATVACAAIFYLAGVLLLPRRLDGRLGDGFTPGMLGAAAYVTICWFGVQLEVPVAHAAAGFVAAAGVAAIAGRRRIAARLRAQFADRRPALGALGGFALLYLVAYLFTMPPATGEYLPLRWTGNLDLMTYLRYTRYLMSLGPSNLSEFTYFNYVYLQTPGVFYLLGGLSFLFGIDPLSAAMPAQFALSALIATLAARISQSVFNLPARASLVIGAIFLVGPFFRYVVANFFLSTLMAMPVLLYLLWRTAEVKTAQKFDAAFAVELAAAYLLLLFIYPFLLLAGIGLQAGVVVLMSIAGLLGAEQASARRDAVARAGRTLVTVSIVLAAIAVCFWGRITWSLEMIVSLSERGVAGWPLDLISPRAMFGWPGTRSGAVQVAADSRAAALAIYGGITALLVAVHFWWARAWTTPAQSGLAGLLGASIVLYCVYYQLAGPSYQQWKFASYSLLPLSFVAYAGVMNVWWNSPLVARLARSATDRRLTAALPALAAVILLGGNAAAHFASDPPLRVLPGSLKSVADVNDMEGFRDITVSMAELPDELPTWAALYYLPDKRVHVVSKTFMPSEPLDLAQITPQRPLLLHRFGCEGVGHNETRSLPGFGCLLFEPPSLQTGVDYPYGRTFLFVSYEGMTGRDPGTPGGRWNRRPTLELKLTADPERAQVARDLYLNLFLNPFLPEGVKPQRLQFTWPNGDRGETAVADQTRISLPVKSRDWVGNRLWNLAITIGFPDGRTILFHDLSLTESPRGTLVARLAKDEE